MAQNVMFLLLIATSLTCKLVLSGSISLPTRPPSEREGSGAKPSPPPGGASPPPPGNDFRHFNENKKYILQVN